MDVVEAVEDINDMKFKIDKLETMFEKILGKVDQISKDMTEIRNGSRRQSLIK